MAKSPNTTPFNGVSHQFTQDYPGWQNNFVNALYVLADQKRQQQVDEELALLDQIDAQVDAMTHFPEVLAMLQEINS